MHDGATSCIQWASAGLVFLALVCAPGPVWSATGQDRYYGHDTVEDTYGVIAPWYQEQNGVVDLRVRVAAEFLKRYPWVAPPDAIIAGPHYIFNPYAKLDGDGGISVLPPTDWMNGDVGQRFRYIIESIPRYYRYTGDPSLLGHLKIAADFVLDGCQTPDNHPWPRFPISVPVAGKAYDRAAPGGYMQLDLSAGMGLGMIRAYQLTGDRRYLEAAQHWGDVFAEKCNHQSGVPPWSRYANPEEVKWGSAPTGNLQTGGVASILLFLDELVRLGYTGRDGAIVEAREAGEAYLRDTLLPAWHVRDTWGHHYWDWVHDVHGVVTTGWVAQYLMDHKEAFLNWDHDLRNILSLYLHHACASPQSNGDVYSGAWAVPEGPACCGRSLDNPSLLLSRYWARYAAEADSEWGREIVRRMMILNLYDFHESGVVEDNIDGGQIIASTWSEIIGMAPLQWALEFSEWLPEIGAAPRENHLVRSASTVTHIVYAKGRIEYTVFDAPQGGIDVLRLAFRPNSVRADGKRLALQDGLARDGYTLKPLGDGDWLVTIRHDRKTAITVRGDDPQDVTPDGRLDYEGPWTVVRDRGDLGGSLHVANMRGSAVTCRFDGNQVRAIGRVDPYGGLADVFLDGVKQTAGIDCWHPTTRHQQVLYYRSGLPNGPHELQIVARGEGNPHATDARVFIDAVQSSAAVGPYDFGSGGGPTGPQRMILGYAGRQPYVDSAGNEWVPATELVVRSGHHTDPVALAWRAEPIQQTIEGTGDPELYRYGVHAPSFWANLTVGPGMYRVRLCLVETREETDPKRTPMSVAINGQEVAADVDVAAQAGGRYKALDLEFADIQPQNGIVEVRFTASGDGEALAQAIELTPHA